MSEVIVLTGKNCPNCDMLKQMLDWWHTEYRTVDVQTDEGAALLSQTNARSVPILMRVEGIEVKKYVVGIANRDEQFQAVIEDNANDKQVGLDL